MQTVIFMMAIGRMTRRMALVNIPTRMELSTRGTGLTINNMEKEKKSGQMGLSTKVNTSTERRTASVSSAGRISPPMAVILLTTISMAPAHTHGLMAVSSTDHGQTTKCMAKVSSPGPMDVSMRATTSMTRKKVMACLSGPTAANMMDSGKMESRKELVFTITLEERRDTVGGTTANGASG